jgi:hypothetical protein
VTRVKDGRSWRIGTASEVAWIAAGTATGLTITSAIPPVFDAYATIVVPDEARASDEHDRAVLALLCEYSPDPSWWLGYLDVGDHDVVFPDAPMVRLYADWPYVLVEAGPQQAATWRSDRSSGRGPVPDVVFPGDHAWLLSTLWDDDWRCLGGSGGLVEAVLLDPRLDARRVRLGDIATPPGHVAI